MPEKDLNNREKSGNLVHVLSLGLGFFMKSRFLKDKISRVFLQQSPILSGPVRDPLAGLPH